MAPGPEPPATAGPDANAAPGRGEGSGSKAGVMLKPLPICKKCGQVKGRYEHTCPPEWVMRLKRAERRALEIASRRYDAPITRKTLGSSPPPIDLDLPDVERGGASSVTKSGNGSDRRGGATRCAFTLPRARSPQPALVPSTPGAKRGRPRVHSSPSVRPRAYRDRHWTTSWLPSRAR